MRKLSMHLILHSPKNFQKIRARSDQPLCFRNLYSSKKGSQLTFKTIPEVNSVCVAFLKSDQTWYRAKISKRISPFKVEVFIFYTEVFITGRSVVKHIAIVAGGPGFDSWVGKSDTVWPTAHHRCDVFSELCCPRAKPRRWIPPLVTRFGVFHEYNQDFIIIFFELIDLIVNTTDKKQLKRFGRMFRLTCGAIVSVVSLR